MKLLDASLNENMAAVEDGQNNFQFDNIVTFRDDTNRMGSKSQQHSRRSMKQPEFRITEEEQDQDERRRLGGDIESDLSIDFTETVLGNLKKRNEHQVKETQVAKKKKKRKSAVEGVVVYRGAKNIEHQLLADPRKRPAYFDG